MERPHLIWLGPALRRLRETTEIDGRTLSGKEISELADIRPATVSRVETGKVDPTMGTVIALLEVLGKDLADLQRAADEIQGQARTAEPEPEIAPEPEAPMRDFFSFEDPAVREGARRLLGLMLAGGGPPSPDVQKIADKIDAIDRRVASLEAVDPEDQKPNGTNGQH